MLGSVTLRETQSIRNFSGACFFINPKSVSHGLEFVLNCHIYCVQGVLSNTVSCTVWWRHSKNHPYPEEIAYIHKRVYGNIAGNVEKHACVHTYHCSAQFLSHDYDLASHTTYVIILSISGRTDSLKPTPNNRYAEKLF